MKIGIDVSFLARDSRGMGRVTRAVLDYLFANFKCEYYFIMPLHAKEEAAVRKLYPYSEIKFISPNEANSLDLVWFPWNRVDFFPLCKRVVTIHDTAMYRFFSNNKQDSYKDRQRVKEAATAAHIIITPSEFSKSEIVTFLDIPPDKIVVIPHGADECFTPASSEGAVEFLMLFSEGEPYILYVGSNDKRKNLETLLSAFDEFKNKYKQPHKLLIAGKRPPAFKRTSKAEKALRVLFPGKKQERLSYVAEKMEHKKDVVWLGPLSDSDLTRLYGLSSVFVFPSLYEGFGVPLLEAFACAAPVIAADIPVFREIGGEAPFYFDPRDPSDLAEKINRVVTSSSLAAKMRARGFERLQNYTWGKSCAQYINLFKSLI